VCWSSTTIPSSAGTAYVSSTCSPTWR
jgi:hypothetical protein